MDGVKCGIISLLRVLCVAFLTGPVSAAENSELINKAGMQRMLSQQIAKAYLYQAKDVYKEDAILELESARGKFNFNHKALTAGVKDSEIQEALSSVDVSASRLNTLVTQPYSKENAAQVLQLSETLLEASHNIVLQLEQLSASSTDRIINISGKQRMLSQRIAKYYIAYSSGFQDESTVYQLQNATRDFNSALNLLLAEGRNTPEITHLLNTTKEQWKKVEPFFLDVRKGGLPIMVLTTTNNLTDLANEITVLYVQALSSN